MTAKLAIVVDRNGVFAYGGKTVQPEGALHVEVDPDDLAAGHAAISSMAQEAHAALDAAALRMHAQVADTLESARA